MDPFICNRARQSAGRIDRGRNSNRLSHCARRKDHWSRAQSPYSKGDNLARRNEHGELENAGRQPAGQFTASACSILRFPVPDVLRHNFALRYPHVIVGENRTFHGEEELLRDRGVILDVLQDSQCMESMHRFIREKPELWNEDIGV